jgi:translation initiation factor 1
VRRWRAHTAGAGAPRARPPASSWLTPPPSATCSFPSRARAPTTHTRAPLPGFPGGPTDPFSTKGVAGQGKIHVRVQQRNGRKCITTIQGLDDDLDLKRICKHMKKSFNCNGNLAQDEDMGEIVQLQGDQRQNVRQWILDQEIVTKAEADERVVLHGF